MKTFLKNKTVVLSTSAAVLLLVAGVALAMSHNNPSSQSTVPKTPDLTNDTTSAGNSTKENSPNDQSTSDSSAQSSNANTSNSPGVSVSFSNTYQQANGDLIVQTQLGGLNSGSCKLTLTQGSYSITKTADVLYQPSFSTCKGFTVPIGEFSAGGIWQASLVVNNGQQLGSTQKQISIIK